MWANASPAYHSRLSTVAAVQTSYKPAKKNVHQSRLSPRDPKSCQTSTTTALVQLDLPSLDPLPSPQYTLGRFYADMKSVTSRRHGRRHKIASSSSASSASSASSITSLTSELDQKLDNLDLVRPPSSASIDSQVLSNDMDAPQDLTALAKRLLNRRRQSKQETASSGSSFYSPHLSVEASSGSKESSALPRLFTKRKSSRDDSPASQKPASQKPASQKRLHISGPFNFQHVAHTNPSLVVARHTGSLESVRRFIKSGKLSSLTLPSSVTTANRHPPQRPPRSPLEPPPIPTPPPRSSSRQMLSPAHQPIDRPLTSCDFQPPQPFPFSSPVHHYPPAFTSLPSLSQESLVARPRTATPEPAWPLASPTIASSQPHLPHLPPDDGNSNWDTSSYHEKPGNIASLRGSRSVPTLSRPAQQRPVSEHAQDKASSWPAESKTELDTSPVQSPLLDRSSWEDDIDYCYEHQAEADCDYQWERPSIEIAHDGMIHDADPTCSALNEPLAKSSARPSSGMLSTSGFEASALSRASQLWPVLDYEAVASITDATHRAVTRIRPEQGHNRLPAIRASREDWQAIQFSPSLLIPHDYLRACRRRRLETTLELPESPVTQGGMFLAKHNQEDDQLGTSDMSHRTPHSLLQHSSTAISESNYAPSSGTESVGNDRYASTNSSWTSLTRFTPSSSSLNKLATLWAEETSKPATVLAAAPEDVAPELVVAKAPPEMSFYAMHKSHASESNLASGFVSSAAALQQLTDDKSKPHPARARASSLNQPPPVGQYAFLLRSDMVRARGDRI